MHRPGLLAAVVNLSGPLHGIKVLDLSRVLAGPWAGQLLADFGADVVKVEKPGSGDDTRHWGPPWFAGKDNRGDGDAAYYLAANRNKRSITVNFSHPLGQELLQELARGCDVVIENFRPGVLARFRLDAATLREMNTALVYCSISGYGQTGGKAQDPGYDAMIQASAGLMSITGAPDDEGGAPLKVGVAVSDLMAGMYAVTAILAALHARTATGRGQHIDIPLYDSQVAWLANQGMNYLVSGDVPGRLGNAHPNIVPYQAFKTRDGHLMLAVGNDRQFQSCAECLGRTELAADPAFATNAARVEHRRELADILGACLREKTTAAWIDKLRQCGVPAGPINSLADVLSGPHAAERQLVRQLPHPTSGPVPTIANPVRFSETPVCYERAPPRLGEHTHAVLSEELGYGDAKIAALGEAGVI